MHNRAATPLEPPCDAVSPFSPRWAPSPATATTTGRALRCSTHQRISPTSCFRVAILRTPTASCCAGRMATTTAWPTSSSTPFIPADRTRDGPKPRRSPFNYLGDPDLQYYVTAEDGQRRRERPVERRHRRSVERAPSPLASCRCRSTKPFRTVLVGEQPPHRPGQVLDYRVYSTSYDLQQCDESGWVLKGSTVSESYPHPPPRGFRTARRAALP